MMKTRIHKDTCIPAFTVALFTIAKTWKQPECPSADEWIRKLWSIYTMGYYSAIKKNTFVDGSPPGSPVSGILQARTLEWVAISFSNT